MTSLDDPYRDLGASLVRAARRLEPLGSQSPRASRRAWPRWASRHMFAVLVIGGLATATAAAGVVAALHASPSVPIAGRLPAGVGAAVPGESAALARDRRSIDRYSVDLMPALTVGQPGWCTLVRFRGPASRSGSGGEGCGPAPTTHRFQLAAGTDNNATVSLNYAIVDSRVAGVRFPDGHTVTPAASSTLPEGLRIAIDLSTTSASSLDQLTNERPWTFLNANGVALDDHYSRRDDQRDFATRQPIITVPSGRRTPRQAGCSLELQPGGRWSSRDVSSYRVIRNPARRGLHLNGRPLLPCAQLTFPRLGHRLVATLMIDANDPTAEPAPLTGLRPGADGGKTVRTGGGLVGSKSLSETARNVGGGWIVVRGRFADERAALIRQLSFSIRG